MTQYLLSLPHDSAEEVTMATMDPAELADSGAFVFAAGLMPPSTATTVDNTGEELRTVSGPFVEAAEYLGGFWVIDVADRATAVEWAAKASKALSSRVEVRALQEAPSEE